MSPANEHLNDPVLAHARKDFATLRSGLTVQQALDDIRRHGIGEKIVYFYVVGDDEQLVGVVPTRRLLTAPLEKTLAEIMIGRVIAIPDTATLLEVCELFAMHKLLAFPVVDARRRMLGVVDVSLFTEEVFDIAEREHTAGCSSRSVCAWRRYTRPRRGARSASAFRGCWRRS